jgi:hypothetical protein
MGGRKKIYNAERQTTIVVESNGDRTEYSVRGGICWPVRYELEGFVDFGGYALMCAQNIETKEVRVLSQMSFVSVEHIFGELGKIERKGLYFWLNLCWAHWFCLDYYWNQPFDYGKKYRLEVLRHPGVQPKPNFIEVPWTTDDDAAQLIWQHLKLDLLDCGREGTPLFEQLNLFERRGRGSGVGSSILPAVRALECVLLAYERFPWRRPINLIQE